MGFVEDYHPYINLVLLVLILVLLSYCCFASSPKSSNKKARAPCDETGEFTDNFGMKVPCCALADGTKFYTNQSTGVDPNGWCTCEYSYDPSVGTGRTYCCPNPKESLC